MSQHSSCSSLMVAVRSSHVERLVTLTEEENERDHVLDYHSIDQTLLDKMMYDSLVWSSLNGFVVGNKAVEGWAKIPGMGLVHAPFALLPARFPENHWREACELAPIFNELIDRVSLDGKFLQDSLSRTKKVDAFTSRLLDIHMKMLETKKTEEIRLGLHRSDYMLDEKTKSLLQIEMNTISCALPSLASLVSKLHRNLLKYYGDLLGLDSSRIASNDAVSQFAEAFAKAWTEYNRPGAVVLFVIQAEERNMYDQLSMSTILREKHNIRTIRKTLTEIDEEGEVLPDETLSVDGQVVSVIYFRAGYTPNDYPSESEWRARLLMERSSAVKCPSISYHLAGTKKIQQELAKPAVLERFLEDKEDIGKVRKCFAGLWSLDDSDTIRKAIERPDLFVMKPQREGGGNNMFGDNLREALLRLQKDEKEEDAAFILMQRIFPAVAATFFVRNGCCYKEYGLSELGIFAAYLRKKDEVIINEHCGYLMRTKVSSSDEGGFATGFSVLDSVYLS